MVEQITAWRDRDGSLHTTEQAAKIADARAELKSLFRNEGVVNDILNNVGRVFDAIAPLCLNIELNTQESNKSEVV